VTIPVVAGRTYNFNFNVQAGKGYTSEGICGTVNSSVSFDVMAGAVTTNLAQAHTQTGAGVLVSPPVSCTTNGVRNPQFGANGVAGQSRNITGSYTATSTGNITLRMRFTNTATTAGNGDDWRITPSFTSCTR
jgi:hypothetical protein